MLIHIENVLAADEAARVRAVLAGAEWIDGRATAGAQSARAKDNLQLACDDPLAAELGERILAALQQHPLFMAAALPLKVFPPLFNCYNGGQSFGTHVDNAIRSIAAGPRLRTDLSATLFLTSPEEYDGGELIIEDTYGTHAVKLPAGHMVLYPSTSLHRVEEVTRGARISSFFWIQSMIRADEQRALLLELDLAVQRLSAESPGDRTVVQLTGVYHNLIRMWAEL